LAAPPPPRPRDLVYDTLFSLKSEMVGGVGGGD
jgi:hypothetical protein